MNWATLANRPGSIAFLATLTTFSPSSNPSFSTSLIPLQHRPVRSTRKRRPSHNISQSITNETNEDNTDEEDDESEMTVYKKNGGKRQYNGDSLPFDVSVISPPPEYLGRFRLDPRTHNGDIVEHDGRQFVVKCVRMRYKYSQGRYQMIGKAIEVKSLARKSIESFLERALRDS